MSEREKYPVLDHIVNTLKNAIADAKVENPSPNEYIIKDGNDEILLKQMPNEVVTTVFITDNRRIIYSEDLLETLQQIHMHKDVKGNQELKNALEKTTIIINDLNIETELIFQAIKDFLDQLSNSYEFIQTVENNITKIGAGFKFGKHIFRVNITNEPEKISIEPRFSASFDSSIQQTITIDINKVQVAVNKMFKED
jgi:deoxyxylulose-5-phosphate synthase